MLTLRQEKEKKSMSYVTVKIDCQLDRVKNHSGGNSLGIFVRKFLDWINRDWETNSNCGYHEGKGAGSSQPALICIYMLTVDAMCPLMLSYTPSPL